MSKLICFDDYPGTEFKSAITAYNGNSFSTCLTALLFFSLAPDLSRGHDAFAAAKLPPCFSCNQWDRHGSGLNSFFPIRHWVLFDDCKHKLIP